MASLEDLYEDNRDTGNIQIHVRHESIELSRSFFRQFVERSSSSLASHLIISNSNKEYHANIDVDPRIFNTYLLYLQSGYLIRCESISGLELINGLRICGASSALLTYCERFDSTFSHEYYCQLSNRTKKIREKLFKILILFGFLFASCILTIDLYRQMLILTGQDLPIIFIILVYIIDGILFVYTFIRCILRVIHHPGEWKQLRTHPEFFVDIISCLGILLYFCIQRPITSIYSSRLNWLWIIVHTCRTFRFIHIGYCLFDIQWCLNAISRCSSSFLQTIIGLIWFFTFSGSILYTMGLIEHSSQFSNAQWAFLSAHETLCALGYRNNAPYDIGTRLCTLISIYILTPLVQMLLWWFQNQVALEWMRILKMTTRTSKQ